MKKLHLVFLSGFFSLLILSPVFAARYDHGMPGIYNLTPFTLGDGEGSGLATDNHGNLLISASSTITAIPAAPTDTTQTYIFSNSSSTVNIKSSAGRLHGVVLDNTSGSKLYVQFYDSTSAPALGASSTFSIPISSGNQMIMDASYFQYLQKYFSTGIEMVISSAFATSSPSSGYTGINIMVEYD